MMLRGEMKDTDYNLLRIKEYNQWTLYLHENQCYLGRVYLLAKREDAIDLMNITFPERKEFFDVGKKVVAMLTKLFQPDMMNYASLGNRFKHLHVHFIPRYMGERIVRGVSFCDNRWGRNYLPYESDFSISQEKLYGLRDDIIDVLSSDQSRGVYV